MTALTVVIPLPDELPTANNRRVWHWGKLARVGKEMRQTAALCATSARNKAGLPRAEGKRYMTAELVRRKSRGRRALDTDGYISALKNCIDGIVDGGAAEGDDPSRLAWVGVTQSWGTRDYVVLRISDRLEEVAA